MAKKSKYVYDADGVPFTIYASDKPTKAGRKTYWLLEDFSTGKRRTLNNVSREAAERRADEIRGAMVKGQAHRLLLSNGQWQDVCIALDVLRSSRMGVSLSEVIRVWLDCMLRLNGRANLMDVVKSWLAQNGGKGPQPTPTRFDEGAKNYHAFKVAEGKSESHCGNILSRLNRLVAQLPNGVLADQLTAGQLENIVVGFGLSPKTRNEYKVLLTNFFTWAGKQNPPLVAKGFNPAKEMQRYRVVHSDAEFLHVNQLKLILLALPPKRPDLLPLVVLVCFAGLRPSEAARLEWGEIGEHFIRLPGRKSKTGRNRQIPIQDNLKAWLACWRKPSGDVCPDVSLEHVNTAIRRFSGVQVSHDAMRHGYGTYRQRIVQNIGTVAYEMGNTIPVCQRHYVNAFCTEAEAVEWFSIRPQENDNIITLGNIDQPNPLKEACPAPASEMASL